MYWIKWLCPGMNIKRWLLLLMLGLGFFTVGVMLFAFGYGEEIFFLFVRFIVSATEKKHSGYILVFWGVIFLSVGFLGIFVAGKKIVKTLLHCLMPDSDQKLADMMFTRHRLDKGPRVTVVGGGTGLSILLRGMKQITSNCTAVVAATDDGGSSGRLREELGITPPGDLRNCLVALADTEPLMSDLMQYRFKAGNSFTGHSFGNLFLAAMADVAGDMENGLSAASTVLKVRGRVIPATLDSVSLSARMSDGSIYEGETNITAAGKNIERLNLLPPDAAAAKSAVQAIMEADMLVLGPGSLYTSVITNLLVPGIREAVLKSSAVKVYICNVMTQPGETDGYSTYDHVNAIFEHVGEPFLDYVVVSKQTIKQNLLDKYAAQGAYPVKPDSGRLMCLGIHVLEANLISEENLVRHHPVQLAKTLLSLIYRLRLSGGRFKLLEYYFTRDSIRRIDKIIGRN